MSWCCSNRGRAAIQSRSYRRSWLLVPTGSLARARRRPSVTISKTTGSSLMASRMTPGAAAQQNPTGGLGGLLDQLRQGGLEQAVNSWIGTGQNHAISPTQLHQALGQETVDELAEQTGLPHDDLLSQLSRV